MIGRILHFALLCALLFPVAVTAQSQPAPSPLTLNAPVEGLISAETQVGCYALSTKPGEPVSIAVQAGFKVRMKVGRGALCNAFTPQYDTTDARLAFKAAGGRYIVAIAGASPSDAGGFTLIAGNEDAGGSGDVPAAPSGDETRKQLMAQQVQQRRNEIAAAEARQRAEEARLRAEEEARREQERQARIQAEQERQENMAAFMGALTTFSTTFNSEMNKYAEQEAERAEMLRGLQRQVEDAEDARNREERRQHAEAEARRQQQAQNTQSNRTTSLAYGGSSQSSMTSATQSGQPDRAAETKAAQKARDDKARADAMVKAKADAKARADAEAKVKAAAEAKILAEKAAPRLIPMPEAVVVCPLAESYAGICYGPFQNISQNHKKAEGMALACGTSSGGGMVRDLGYYGDFHVWGCQFGLNPEKSDSPNRDIADKFGLIVPARRTYRCDAEIHGYCRTM